jgi:squalene-hopene/tetraprenyl-beta-curcumene cyclase
MAAFRFYDSPRPAIWMIVLVLLVSAAVHSGWASAADDMVDRIDHSLAAGTHFLIAAQSADGAWRSDVYAPFKEGDALTPLVVNTLLVQQPSEPLTTACAKGSSYLVKLVEHGAPDHLNYPAYAAPEAIVALSAPQYASYRQVRAAWLKYLTERQMVEDLDWSPDDPDYGGWGYAADLPRKPAEGEVISPLHRANLSATTFALESLRAAGCPPQDPKIRKALSFVARCQNRKATDQKPGKGGINDGGFFFVLDDPVRNKAGLIQVGQPEFRSYGSATADGLRCLLAGGLDPQDGRIVAAWHWLRQNFSAKSHPGEYAADREHARNSLYFYYACSVARALHALELRDIRGPDGAAAWSQQLADELMRRQRPDGSWSNPNVDVREDDPLVASAFALRALGACRASLKTAGR